MPKRKSFAGRVKAASKRASARGASAHPAPNRAPQPPDSPATARLRDRERAADPEGTFVPDPSGAPDTSTPTSKRRAAATPTSNIEHPTSSPERRRARTTQSPQSPVSKPQTDPDPGYVAVGRVLGPFGLKGELKVLPLTDNPDRFKPKARLYAALATPTRAAAPASSASMSPADPTPNISSRVAAGDQHPTSTPGRRDPQPATAPSLSARVAVGDQSLGQSRRRRPVSRPESPQETSPQPVTVLRAREASGHLYLTFKGFPDRDTADRFRHALLQVPESDLPPLPEGEYYRFQLIGLNVVDTTGAPLGTLDEVIETGSNDVYRVHPAEGADILLPALADVVVSVDLAARTMVVDPPEWR